MSIRAQYMYKNTGKILRTTWLMCSLGILAQVSIFSRFFELRGSD